MSPIDKDIVRRKLGVITQNLNVLQPIETMSEEDYIEDIYKRKAAERLLQELIEAAIDINVHIIVQMGNTPPDDYFESFIRAGKLKIIPAGLAEELAPSSGLRNRLVHEYDQLEDTLVLNAVRKAEALYSQYVKEIEDFITQPD